MSATRDPIAQFNQIIRCIINCRSTTCADHKPERFFQELATTGINGLPEYEVKYWEGNFNLKYMMELGGGNNHLGRVRGDAAYRAYTTSRNLNPSYVDVYAMRAFYQLQLDRALANVTGHGPMRLVTPFAFHSNIEEALRIKPDAIIALKVFFIGNFPIYFNQHNYIQYGKYIDRLFYAFQRIHDDSVAGNHYHMPILDTEVQNVLEPITRYTSAPIDPMSILIRGFEFANIAYSIHLSKEQKIYLMKKCIDEKSALGALLVKYLEPARYNLTKKLIEEQLARLTAKNTEDLNNNSPKMAKQNPPAQSSNEQDSKQALETEKDFYMVPNIVKHMLENKPPITDDLYTGMLDTMIKAILNSIPEEQRTVPTFASVEEKKAYIRANATVGVWIDGYACVLEGLKTTELHDSVQQNFYESFAAKNYDDFKLWPYNIVRNFYNRLQAKEELLRANNPQPSYFTMFSSIMPETLSQDEIRIRAEIEAVIRTACQAANNDKQSIQYKTAKVWQTAVSSVLSYVPSENTDQPGISINSLHEDGTRIEVQRREF